MMNLASEDNLYVLGVGTDLKIGQFGLLGTYDIPFFNTVLQPSECGDIKIISSKGTIIRADKTYYDPSTKTAYSATAVTRTFFFFNCNSCNNGLAIKLISDPDTGATSGLIIP